MKITPQRRLAIAVFAFWMAALAAPIAAPALAGGPEEEPRPVKLTGFITDEWCGKANANPKGAECARACAKKGSDLVLYADGKIYKLSDKQLALGHLGYEVVVRGTLDTTGLIRVESIEKAKKSPEAGPTASSSGS